MSERDPAADSARARLRLLQEVRRLLLDAPETHSDFQLSGRRLRVVRGQVSVTVGIAAAKLQESGFNQTDRLYRIREQLAEGRAISNEDILWLDRVIDEELRHGRQR